MDVCYPEGISAGIRCHSTLCWQILRGLTVSVPLMRMWVHCPRASNGLLPRRSNLVGYVRWGARSDRFPPCQTIIFSSFTGRTPNRDKPPETRRKEPESETGAPDKANAMPRYASLRKLFSTVLAWDCVGLGQ